MHELVKTRNAKTGPEVGTIDLPPKKTCKPEVPCAKACYALDGRFKTVIEHRERNLAAYNRSPSKFFSAIFEEIIKKNLSLIRFHAAGDFPSSEYLRRAYELATSLPHCRFLAFTKRDDFDLHLDNKPNNFTMVFSVWPGHSYEPYRVERLPKAYIDSPSENRVPHNAYKCSAGCQECCYACWGMGYKDAVVFKPHGVRRRYIP